MNVNSERHRGGNKAGDLLRVSTVVSRSERLLRDDRGDECFPYDHYAVVVVGGGGRLDRPLDQFPRQGTESSMPAWPYWGGTPGSEVTAASA